MPSLSRSRFPTLLCAVAVLLAFAPASAALPYSSICDGEGNVPDSQALGEALLGHPESLIPIYEDSQRRVPRAVKCWQQLEAIYQGVGRGMAEVASGPRCVMADVLPYCRPGGEAFDLLSKAGPGGERLKTLALAAFEERMRELRPHRVLIESAATLAMVGSVAGKQLAGVKAAETRELSKLKQESRAGAGEPMLSAELALLEEVELPREVLEFKLAEAEGAEKTGRMTANLGSLEKLRPIAERPPAGAQVSNKLWSEYVEYWNRRYGELKEAQQQGSVRPRTMPVKPPLEWDAYKLFRQCFIEAIRFQRAFTAKLRADGKLPREKRTFLQRFIDALVGENVGVSKGKGARPSYVDQLVSEANPIPGQPPQVDVFSVKQRALENATAKELTSIFDADADEVVTKYSGIIEVRRPGHPLFGKQVQVTRVHLIYDASLKPLDLEALDSSLKKFRSNHSGIEILFQ